MKSRLIKRTSLFALVTLTVFAFSSAKPAAVVNEEVTTHYYSCCFSGVDPDSTLMGERTTHCDGHVSRWGQITPYYTIDSVPCP
jgi:Family of unknown function (DUF6289)